VKKITTKEIGECISEAIKTQKKNILFVSRALEYEYALNWFEENPEYRQVRVTFPDTLREVENGILVKREGYYAIPDEILERLNNEKAIMFSNTFSEKCVEDFEGFQNIIKYRFYINKFPDGTAVKHSVEKLPLFVAFTDYPEQNSWSTLSEEYYNLFDEVYLLD